MGQFDRRMIVNMLDIRRREEKRKEEEREKIERLIKTTSRLPHDAYGIIIQNKNEGKRE